MSDTRKLPVFGSLGEVLSGVTRHYFQLLMVAWPAVVFIIAAAFMVGWQYYDAGLLKAYVSNNGGPDLEAILAAQAKLSAPDAQIINLVSQLVLVLASAVAAVRWHRFVLLGEGANGLGGVQLLRREDGSYIWTTIKIILVVIVAAALWALLAYALTTTMKLGVPLSAITLVLIVTGLAFYILLFRISLALPDASLGQGGRMRFVFGQSKGNSLRLVGFVLLLLLAMLGIGIAVALIVTVAVTALGLELTTSPAALAVVAILYLGVYLYFVMAQITMLSVAYREIIGLPQVPGGQ